MSTVDVGRVGEALAARALTDAGMRILARNVRTPDGEIDLVARDGAVTVFVEVKLRRSRRFGSALAAVDARKRARVRAAAADMLQYLPDASRDVRFDVVTIEDDRAVLHRGAF